MQELDECQGFVGAYMQPLVFAIDPEAGLIGMQGRACQKAFLGGGFPRFPRFKRIIKPLDVAKTGDLKQFDTRDGLHQLNASAQRLHLGVQKVDRKCLDAIAKLQRTWHVLGKTPLDSGAALGAILDFRDDLHLFNRVFDIDQNTLFASRWFDIL